VVFPLKFQLSSLLTELHLEVDSFNSISDWFVWRLEVLSVHFSFDLVIFIRKAPNLFDFTTFSLQTSRLRAPVPPSLKLWWQSCSVCAGDLALVNLLN